MHYVTRMMLRATVFFYLSLKSYIVTGSTHAHLTAVQVIDACRGTLRSITWGRHKLLNDIAESKRHRHFLLPRRSMQVAMKMLTEPEHEIVRLHRSREENKVNEILALALAAMADDPTFRVYVTAKDFQLICEHYTPEDYNG